MQGVVHHRQVQGLPGFSFIAPQIEYHMRGGRLRWHLNPRLEYGFWRGRPDGWQSRLFFMLVGRWRFQTTAAEGRVRYEWFWDFDGHQGAHQRLRPAVFSEHPIFRNLRLQFQVEPMYWTAHRRYAAPSINQWRFFMWALRRWGAFQWRIGPALFYQLQPRQTVLLITADVQSRIKKPTAKGTSPPDQTPH